MVRLETENGKLTTEIGVFTPEFSHAELEQLISLFEITYKVDYDDVRTYRFVPRDKDAAPVMLSLLGGKLQFVEVLPNEEEGISEETGLEQLLESLGGAREYSWGHVRLVEHHKAGYSSVYVIYHSKGG